MKELFYKYKYNLEKTLNDSVLTELESLCKALELVWENNNNFFICGNGGSAGNANHIANDFLYGVASNTIKPGMKVESLSSNTAVVTCLANDIGYENVYSEQVRVKGSKDDLLLILSGSGNSQNVINALNAANEIGMHTFAILGYDGGKCKQIAKNIIHFKINDMQISEDLQLVAMHMCMQWLYNKSG